MRFPTTRFVAVLVLFSLSGCAKFEAGDCIQNPQDGFVYRVTKVMGMKYQLQGWFNGKWGLSVDGPTSTFDSRYIKITCPFATEVIKEN